MEAAAISAAVSNGTMNPSFEPSSAALSTQQGSVQYGAAVLESYQQQKPDLNRHANMIAWHLQLRVFVSR